MRCCLSRKDCHIMPFPRRCMPSSLFSIWLTLRFPFFTTSLLLYFHNWENETFCVKCGLNADHFSSLVRMRTLVRMRAESAIAAFYGRTDFCVDVLLSDVTEENPLPGPLPSTKVSSETTSRSGLEYYRKSWQWLEKHSSENSWTVSFIFSDTWIV